MKKKIHPTDNLSAEDLKTYKGIVDSRLMSSMYYFAFHLGVNKTIEMAELALKRFKEELE